MMFVVDSCLGAVAFQLQRFVVAASAAAADSDPVRGHVAGQLESGAVAEEHQSAGESRSQPAARRHTDRHAASHQLLHVTAQSRRHAAMSALRLPRLARHAVAR